MIHLEDVTIEDCIQFWLRTICRLRHLHCPAPVASFTLTLSFTPFTLKGDLLDMATIGQLCTASVTDVLDAAGNPTAPKTPPTWTTNDPAILTLTPSADGMTATGTVMLSGTIIVTAAIACFRHARTRVVTAAVDGITQSKSAVVSSGDVASFTLNLDFATPPSVAPKRR